MSALEFAYRDDTDGPMRAHVWTAKGERGAVHIWAAKQPKASFKTGEFYGGIECHFPAPRYEGEAAEPLIAECWLTGKPCWPEGSSLAFQEEVAPFLERALRPFAEAVHQRVYAILAEWYEGNFSEAAE